MGAWSAAILGNDTSCEVYERFIGLYNSENPPLTIAKIVLDEQEENINFDKTNVWLALALACWECKVLTPEIFLTIKTIIESGEDLEFCKELNADQPFLKARKKALEDFLTKIAIERQKPRLIKKEPKQIQTIYAQGICMTYKNLDNKYIGVFLHDSVHFKSRGEIYFCFLNFESNVFPDIGMFEDGKLYGLKKLDAEWGVTEYCGNVVNITYEKGTKNDFFKVIPEVFTIVGALEFACSYKWINNIRGGFMPKGGTVSFINSLENLRLETKGKYPLSDITLKDLLKRLDR
jgi:hypothetical protein